MAKVVLLTFLTAFAAAGLADEVVLTDGRTFTGIVTTEENSVTVKLPYGAMTFEKTQVAQIKFGDLPEAQLAKKLADIKEGDTGALLEAATWAFAHGLDKKGQEICVKILQADPDHAGTRRLLENVKIDGQWRSFDQGMEIARNKLAAGQYDQMVKEILPRLSVATGSEKKRLAVQELMGLSQLYTRQFAAARDTFAAVAAKADGATALRCEAIAESLKENGDGMYLLRDAYPAAAALTGETGRSLKPGPVSLADPLALQAMLRDRARKEIATGRESMAAAEKLEPTDAETAKAKYAQAAKSFDRADALVADISRSYRIEITRRQITILRKEIDEEARKFDAAVDQLGTNDMPPDRYKDQVADLLRRLDDVRDSVKAVLAVAKPYARELVMEFKWAESDLQKLSDMRQILTTELNVPN